MKPALILIGSIPSRVLIGVIRVYQILFSFDHAFWARPETFRICTYHPSCSEFTRVAIEKHGAIKGSIMGFIRIVSCNPRSHGGHDPVPDVFSIKRYQGKNARPAFEY